MSQRCLRRRVRRGSMSWALSRPAPSALPGRARTRDNSVSTRAVRPGRASHRRTCSQSFARPRRSQHIARLVDAELLEDRLELVSRPPERGARHCSPPGSWRAQPFCPMRSTPDPCSIRMGSMGVVVHDDMAESQFNPRRLHRSTRMRTSPATAAVRDVAAPCPCFRSGRSR
jgi:hypothetical protein